MRQEGLINPCLLVKILEFVIGIACYALYLEYFFGVCDATNSKMDCLVRQSLVIVAVIAFPFIITPSLIITTLLHKEFHLNAVNVLQAFGGFICFLVAGSLQLYYLPAVSVTVPDLNIELNSEALIAFGALMVVNSCLYLTDMTYHLSLIRKSDILILPIIRKR